LQRNIAAFKNAAKRNGVFCVSTHYWEVDSPSQYPTAPSVGEHLQYFVAQAKASPRVHWRSVGDTITAPSLMI
jgi:hypothetical protein